jgi:hypothetical protein
MSGDVESQDLDELLSLLNSEVFGKKSSDGICAMKKVMDFYKKSGFFGTPGGGLLGSGDLLKDITKSIEIGEPEFDDVKKDLLNKINNELNSFCSGSGGGDRKSDGNIVVTPRGSSYKDCSGTYSYGCKSPVIAKVQGCLGGLVTDGKFGPKTQASLKSKGYNSFTDADVDKICGIDSVEDTDLEDIDGADPNQI